MADTLEQLIMALAQADSAVAGSDPYASPQAAVDSIRWNPNEYGMGENAVASGLKGLLSGAFGAAGTDYKQRAASEYKDVLSGKVKAPSVLPEELFSKAQNQLGIFRLLKEKDDADKLEAALTKDADRKQGLEDYATKLGIKSEIENTGGKKAIEFADSLRKELGSKKSLADFAEVKNRVEVLKKAKSDPTAISDLDYVYGAAKVLDPASVVRESEAGMVIQSSSIPAAVLGYMNKLTTGGQALSPEVRDSLFKLVKRHYDSRATEIGKELDRYEALANKRGVAPEDVLPFTRKDLEMADEQPVSKDIEDVINVEEAPNDLLSALLAEKAKRSAKK